MQLEVTAAQQARLTQLGLTQVLETLSSGSLPRQEALQIGQCDAGLGGIYAGVSRDKDGEQFDLIVLTDEQGQPLITEEAEYGSRGTELKGADHYSDGHQNTHALDSAGSPLFVAMQKAVANHPRAANAYIPSIGELNIVRANLPDLFQKTYHWSSTQHGAHNARCQTFGDGGSGWHYEYYRFHAFVVRRVYR